MNNYHHFYKHWETTLDLPREYLSLFCLNLLIHSEGEKHIAQGTEMNIRLQDDSKIFVSKPTIIQKQSDIDDALILDRMAIFIYENIEAGFIKNKATQFIYGEEFYKCYHEYYSMLSAQLPEDEFPELQAVYSEDEQVAIKRRFHSVKERIDGFINPREVIECFYLSKTGKTFLPQSLIAYIEKNNLFQQEKVNPIVYNVTQHITNTGNVTNVIHHIENSYNTTMTTSNNTIHQTLNLRDIFLQYRTILQYYNTHHKSRKNDALVERVSLVLHSIDTRLAKDCDIALPSSYQGDDKSKNKSQDLKIAKETDIPKLKKLFPSLPDLP